MTMLEGRTGEWELVIGLEVHAQVISNSKLFSGASTEFGAAPNSQVSFVDSAMPGMLPVVNGRCVEQAVRTGLAIGAKIEDINPHSVFARKNYFYADLPQGYQISQFEEPIVTRGEIIIDLANGETKTVGIERLHLEQDAGKSLHDQHPSKSYIDLNRSGIALMEIVSRPDMRSAEEASAYVTKLRSIMRYIGSCDGNMQEGSLRCDANVSVRKPGGELGTRCEIKNLNSLRFMRQAIEYEAARQIEIIEDGGGIAQETRLYDSGKGETRSMRSKEEAHDYRYFPDPDLLPLTLPLEFAEEQRATLPELPDEKKNRFKADYGLSAYNAAVLTAEKAVAEYYEEFVALAIKVTNVPPERVAFDCAKWLIGDLFGALKKASKEIEESPVTPEGFSVLLTLIYDGIISGSMAKKVFEDMFETGYEAADIVKKQGLAQISNKGAIEAMIDKVVAGNADKVAEYRGGKDKLFGFFVGQVMKASQGKANPAAVNEMLRKKLDG